MLPSPRSRWPRLLSETDAAEYLSIGRTTLRAEGPAPKRVGRRVLFDIRDLDRWADRLSGQPLSEEDARAESAEVERRFLEERAAKKAALLGSASGKPPVSKARGSKP